MIKGTIEITPINSCHCNFNYILDPDPPKDRHAKFGKSYTYPLEKHHEVRLLEKNYNVHPYGVRKGYVFRRITLDKNLNVYYKKLFVINLNQIVQHYFAYPLPDGNRSGNPSHHFHFFLSGGLSVVDMTCHELFARYGQNCIYPGKLKIGNVNIVNSHVRIDLPYDLIKIPYVPIKIPYISHIPTHGQFIKPLEKIDYLMIPMYKRQFYTIILCFKKYGNLPLPFLEQLFHIMI